MAFFLLVFLHSSLLTISRSEICVANFILHVNGACLGNYLVPKNSVIHLIITGFGAKTKTALAAKLANFFEMV